MADSKDDIARTVREQFETCPVCTEPFQERILQCKNSHLCCESCESKLTRHPRTLIMGQCPMCREPVDGRNRQGEQIRGEFIVTCENGDCKAKFKLKEVKKHAEVCLHEPLECGLLLGGEAIMMSDGRPLALHCHHRGSPSEMEAHIAETHAQPHAVFKAARSGTWIFDYQSPRIKKEGDQELIVLIEESGKPSVFLLVCAFDTGGNDDKIGVCLVPCTLRKDDRRRVRTLLYVEGIASETMHTMHVQQWRKKLNLDEYAPCAIVNWVYESGDNTIKVVVCVDPHLDEDFKILNPKLKAKRKRDDGDDVFDPKQVEVGDQIDARDHRGRWYASVVKERKGIRALVHFNAWSDAYDEWMDCTHDNMAVLHTMAKRGVASITPPSSPLRPQQLSQ